METTTITTNEIKTRPADARLLLDQIGAGVLMSCGARQVVDLGDGVHFNVGRGKSTKVVVKLAWNDLFTVERVRMKRNLSVVSEDVRTDVHCEDLPHVVRELGDR